MRNNIEYLWFVGPSGSGKTTAVNNCFQDINHSLRKRLGLEGKHVVLCRESLGERTEDIFDHLKSNYSEFTQPTAVLIKAQWPDLEEKYNTIRKFRSEKQDAMHKLVFLNCDPKEAARRCREERGMTDWEKGYSESQAKYFHGRMVEYVKQLQAECFPIMVIDSSNDDYEIIGNSSR